eukprot:11781613-Alexandrium_andersonii.AAC.1
MSASLVGSEMCIRDSDRAPQGGQTTTSASSSRSRARTRTGARLSGEKGSHCQGKKEVGGFGE